MNYTVKSGETLSGIAGKFNSTVGAIAQANNISNPNRIQAGRQLTIPGHSSQSAFQSSGSAGTTYKVKSGDTLSGIAARFNTTTNALAQANNIRNPNSIQAGQTLKIPGRSGTTPTKPPVVISPTPTGPTVGGLSLRQLQQIMPNLATSKAQDYLPHLNAAMAEAGINTPKRQAAFVAQLAHESGEFRWMEEIADGSAYEGRADLGNTQPGDGRRYKGRGPIQLTGRYNYRKAGAALGLDLEGNPAQAATPQVGFRVAAWYWNSRNLNSYADAGNFDAITYRINGGYNGKADRDRYYQRALSVLT